MLRRTLTCHWQNSQMGPAMVSTRCRNSDLMRMAIAAKERKKIMRYHGSYIQRTVDRDLVFYGGAGGPRGSLILVQRSINPKQYVHPVRKKDRYTIRKIKRFAPIWEGQGPVTRKIWDSSYQVNDGWFGTSFPGWQDLPKDVAVNFAENFGLKHAILDELTQPTTEDFKYIKHKLYAHNFPYLPEPITGAHIGDPDWLWRGDDKIDYSNYGAKTKTPYNRFRPTLFEPLRKLPTPASAKASKK